MKYISYTIISANTSRKELSWELRILLFFFLSLCLCVSPALLGRVKGLTQLLGKGFIWGQRAANSLLPLLLIQLQRVARMGLANRTFCEMLTAKGGSHSNSKQVSPPPGSLVFWYSGTMLCWCGPNRGQSGPFGTRPKLAKAAQPAQPNQLHGLLWHVNVSVTVSNCQRLLPLGAAFHPSHATCPKKI